MGGRDAEAIKGGRLSDEPTQQRLVEDRGVDGVLVLQRLVPVPVADAFAHRIRAVEELDEPNAALQETPGEQAIATKPTLERIGIVHRVHVLDVSGFAREVPHLGGAQPDRPKGAFTTLRDANVLIWGFGNIAKALTPHLTALGATVVSNSYGEQEVDPTSASGATDLAVYNHPGIPILASAGDDGFYDFDFLGQNGQINAPNFPAASPYVIANMHLNPTQSAQ